MKLPARWCRGSPGWLAWVILALAWGATLSVRPLFDPDEGRYAEIPREMLVSGDWVTPRFNDLKYFEKPPLQYWATAAVYKAVGVSEWSSRLWSVAAAFGCLPLVYAWTRRRYGKAAGVAALTALAVSPFFGVVGHLNLLDSGLTFWLTAAVLSFLAAQDCPPGSVDERRWMLLAWGAAALAVLAKGIVVGVLAGGALLVYSVIERDSGVWKRLQVLRGLPLFAAVAAPWFIVVSRRNPGFAQFFFVHEHFARFLTTVHQRVEPWWFFLPLLLLAVLPWLAACVRSLRAGWRDAGAAVAGNIATAARPWRPLRFLLVYCAVTLLFFSASGSKLAPYILPMLPALAIVTGATCKSPLQLTRVAARTVAALVIFIGVGLLIYSARRNNFIPHEASAWVAAAAALSILGVLWVELPRWVHRGTAAVPAHDAAAYRAALGAAVTTILAWQFLLCAYGATPPARSARDLVQSVRGQIPAGASLYSVGQYRETISPYLGRTLQLVAFEGELHFGLDAEPQRRMNLDQFTQHWRAGAPAVAFFDPGVWDRLRRAGLPGRVIGADDDTVAVSRL
ncbi:MAG: glycosyltransferase family 39 protein [Proteobacteria bacterium]|nr:glycosyltransferase family 39 protein [Pseudomonadota bacterium]